LSHLFSNHVDTSSPPLSHFFSSHLATFFRKYICNFYFIYICTADEKAELLVIFSDAQYKYCKKIQKGL
jgi:hypothetical protein